MMARSLVTMPTMPPSITPTAIDRSMLGPFGASVVVGCGWSCARRIRCADLECGRSRRARGGSCLRAHHVAELQCRAGVEHGAAVDAASEPDQRRDGTECEGDRDERLHQLAAPIAMRFGIVSGAVTGKYDTARAQTVSGLPIAANDTK